MEGERKRQDFSLFGNEVHRAVLLKHKFRVLVLETVRDVVLSPVSGIQRKFQRCGLLYTELWTETLHVMVRHETVVQEISR